MVATYLTAAGTKALLAVVKRHNCYNKQSNVNVNHALHIIIEMH